VLPSRPPLKKRRANTECRKNRDERGSCHPPAVVLTNRAASTPSDVSPVSPSSPCTLVISQSDCRGESIHPSARLRLRANDFCKRDRERVRALPRVACTRVSRLQKRNRKDIMVPPFEFPSLVPCLRYPLSRSSLSLALYFRPFLPFYFGVLKHPPSPSLPPQSSPPLLVL